MIGIQLFRPQSLLFGGFKTHYNTVNAEPFNWLGPQEVRSGDFRLEVW